MSKDPAALIYIDKWISSTRGMKLAEKGIYLDLILHQFDKGSIPNNIDELAAICSVRPSEYNLFEQVFEQVLKQKFVQNESGRLENEVAKEVIQRRENFKNKRSNAGKMSYILKFARKNFRLNKGKEDFIRSKINLDIDLKNEQVLKQVLKQILELYINVNEDVNINKDNNEDILEKSEKPFDPEIESCYQKCIEFFPEKLHPKNNIPWLETIDKLNRIDGLSFEKIIEIIKWARNDNFWKGQFLSLQKLRTNNKQGIKYFIVFQEKMKTTINNHAHKQQRTFDINR